MMGLGTGLFLGGIACILIVWYLYRCSKNGTSEDPEQQTDEVYNDDDDSSDDMAADADDGGGFDGSGFA